MTPPESPTEPGSISNRPPTPPAGPALLSNSQALLSVSGLSKRFGGLQAVKDLTFRVGEGEIVALIGPNGAGKTTAFALISGFLAPDAGRVAFAGRDLRGLAPHRVNALGLARTFQIMRPFPRLTVVRNVMIATLGRHPDVGEAERRARAVLDELGLGARADLPASGLTLAERKRLELARALGTEPRLLLLDEVMSGLNDAETERIVELVRAINRRGVAILLIEHVMRAVMSLAGRIVVLNYGERIAEGRPDVVANDPRVIEAYLGDEETTAAPA
jgi:branched-chain amino acid transport system ATP-binding protein